MVDPKITVQLEEQGKQLEEQSAMIKTLNKQLTHCERDLQTHMDLATTLETRLADSEKNRMLPPSPNLKPLGTNFVFKVRKARMHATELARERDNLNSQIENLRNDLSRAQSEVATVRRSIAEEKQSLETRLDEERRAKERVRAQLDSRMDELQKRKSKFACL
jgi:peptidoglycan hydrolase CwlO-like protein